MSQKTIIQHARGYNTSPVTVTIKIDSNVIYQGEIPTINALAPDMPVDWALDLGADSWSWAVAQDFEGDVNMTIDIDNGSMLICDTCYTLESDPDIQRHLDYLHIDNGINTLDPITNVTINNIVQPTPRTDDSAGQWIWKLNAGDSFSCQVNIVPPAPLPNIKE